MGLASTYYAATSRFGEFAIPEKVSSYDYTALLAGFAVTESPLSLSLSLSPLVCICTGVCYLHHICHMLPADHMGKHAPLHHRGDCILASAGEGGREGLP